MITRFIRRTTVLFGDDVIWLKRQAIVLLGNETVLATTSRSFADSLSERPIHYG